MFPPVFIFDVDAFRTQFPAFTSTELFPSIVLQMYWDAGTNYISANNYGVLNNAARLLGLNLMTAHLTQSSVLIAGDETPSIANSAGVDKINISLTPPPVTSQWKWWLNTTAYGAQLLALLEANCAGGFQIGGLPEGSAFRKVYGVF